MIALFDNYLRRWLLGLAVTVRNRAQVVIARMESVEAEKSGRADRQAGPDAAQAARSGGPPVQWVRLVRRHAPELLHPGPPYDFPRASAQVPEREDGAAETSRADIQAPPSDGGAWKADAAQTHAVPKLALNLPRLSKEHADPRSQRLKPDENKQTSDSGGPSKGAAMPAETQRVDSPQAALRTTQAGSVDKKRLQSSPAGAAQSPPRRFLSPERNARPGHPRPPDSGTREAEARTAQPAAARRLPPAAGPIEKSRAAGRERKNIRGDAAEKLRPLKQSGGRDAQDVQFDRQVDGRQRDLSIDTSMPAQRSAIPKAAYESRPQPSEYANELQSAPHREPAPSVAQDKRRGDDPRPAPKIGLVNERPKARPPKDDLIIETFRSRSPEFRWPSLPGEKNYAAAEASHLNPAWPDLPEEQPDGAASAGQQMKPHPPEEKPHNIERLRRLDEEQKGILWSASRF
jgi:hypothetical protein